MTLPATRRRAIVPGDIVFADADAPGRTGCRCPVCGDDQSARPVLTVPQLAPPWRSLQLLRCAGCGSLYFDPPGVSDFADLDQVADDSWRHYVEAGAGVWETLWPILAVRTAGSLLDVGCGFGFTLDFWQRTGRGEAVGSEAADYGRLGAEKFGVRIHPEHVEDCAALNGRRFDIVYASEVIEHVPDPRAFVDELAQHVAEDGVLALTTPAASFVERGRPGLTLLAALAPGFHGFLLSNEALVDSVRSAGFTHVETRVLAERQFVWASRRPLSVAADPNVHLPALHSYLRSRAADPDLDPSVRDGYLYRLLRDLVHQHAWPDAVATRARLAAELAQRYGAEVLDAQAVIARLGSCASSDDVGRIGPYFFPSYFQLDAALARRTGADAATLHRLHAGALRVTQMCAGIAPLHFLEAAAGLWPSVLEGARAGLAAGDDSAGEALAALIDHGGEPDAFNAYTAIPAAVVEAAPLALAEELARRARGSAARPIAAALRRHVVRNYGDAATTQEGVAAALADPSARLPADPLFVPWFDALVLMGDERTREQGRARARELIAVAESARDHPRHGVALAAFARRAREHAGLPPAPPIVALETSFRIAPRRR